MNRARRRHDPATRRKPNSIITRPVVLASGRPVARLRSNESHPALTPMIGFPRNSLAGAFQLLLACFIVTYAMREEPMSAHRVRSPRWFSAKAIAFLVSAVFISPAMAADSGPPIPDLFGQWGRDMLFFEPPPAGPGPVVRVDRKADGTMVVQDPCCTIVQRWLGDHMRPILNPAPARAVKKFGDLADSGTVTPDLHNSCWPEPPPYVMALHFGMQVLQQRDEVTLVYLLHNTVRRVRLNAPHPANLTP